MRFATSGWRSAVFGGFQFSGSYETNPGTLLTFAANGSGAGQANIFFMGDPNSIKLKKQTYNTNYSTGTATIQGFKHAIRDSNRLDDKLHHNLHLQRYRICPTSCLPA
jgi:hypothetical protein